MTSRKKLKAPSPQTSGIVAAVHRKGATLVSLATQAGVKPQVLYMSLYRPEVLSGEIIIAEFLEIDPRALWPDRWSHPTPRRELWLLKNADKLEAWRGNCLEDVGR